MNRRQGLWEMALFFAAAVAGIYGFGRAFQGDTVWLGVSAVSLMALAKQMARIQDHLPSRPVSHTQTATRMKERE